MNDFKNETIHPDLAQNISRIKEISDGSSDVMINEFTLSGIPAALLICEGMVSTSIITDLILEPITNLQLANVTTPKLMEHLNNELLLSLDRAEAKNYHDLFRFLNSGFAVILLHGASSALVYGVQGYDKRSVSEPSGESNVLGAEDGFTETVRVNMSLVRRRMKTPFLKMELFPIGEKSQTDICLCYMYDRVPKSLFPK